MIKHILKTTYLFKIMVTKNASLESIIFLDIALFNTSISFSDKFAPIGLYLKLIIAKVADETISQSLLFRKTFSTVSAKSILYVTACSKVSKPYVL
ncbi:hypothetical protein [Tenacibaculum aestuariivivum]|uniref:hypothetical protein n=1 Tax=Tenacibaculum aestuariivivum TaxID=2006131 RepID=UPI003AB784E4